MVIHNVTASRTLFGKLKLILELLSMQNKLKVTHKCIPTLGRKDELFVKVVPMRLG